ncbi:MAG: MBL fold metallo-hydrolase [Hyphomonadaceae bacterium]
MPNLVWRIGDITITKIVEMESAVVGGGPKSALTETYPERIKEISWLIPHFATDEGHLRMSVHALLVETPSIRLVVDTCVGEDKARTVPHWNKLTGGTFLADMEGAGWPPQSVEGVLCTHLHVDHVGWNTIWRDGRWMPTFPKAKYYMARTEFKHWRRECEAGPQNEFSEFAQFMMNSKETYLDSVKPIFDAGLAVFVETDAAITPEIRLTPTPGHTPGHVSVVLESRGERAVITGDMMHHPCQIAHPNWSSQFDTDPRQSERTRLAFFETFADTPTLIIGTHFAGPTAGRLVRRDGAYRMEI